MYFLHVLSYLKVPLLFTYEKKTASIFLLSSKISSCYKKQWKLEMYLTICKNIRVCGLLQLSLIAQWISTLDHILVRPEFEKLNYTSQTHFGLGSINFWSNLPNSWVMSSQKVKNETQTLCIYFLFQKCHTLITRHIIFVKLERIAKFLQWWWIPRY